MVQSFSKLVTCVVSLSLICLSSSAQDIYTKDGMSLGPLKVFVDQCVSSAQSEMMKYNGMEVNTIQYCTCMGQTLMPTLTSAELFDAIENNTMADVISSEKNFPILMGCLEGNIALGDSFSMAQFNDHELAQKMALMSCVSEFKKELPANDTSMYDVANNYCQCAMDKMFELGMTYDELKVISDPESKAYKEVVAPCMSRAYQMKFGILPKEEED